LPRRPTGLAEILPDRLCGITSPGRERKDPFHHVMPLQRSGVPRYRVISPEDRTLIAYRLVGAKCRVVFSVELGVGAAADRARAPPFEEIEMDVRCVFGEKGRSPLSGVVGDRAPEVRSCRVRSGVAAAEPLPPYRAASRGRPAHGAILAGADLPEAPSAGKPARLGG
jgi:hypothetical protein